MQIFKKLVKFNLLIFSIASIIALVFLAMSLAFNENVKSSKKTSFATRITLNHNLNEETPVLCNYKIDSDSSSIFQDCTNLIKNNSLLVVAELDFFAHFKVGSIELIDQDNHIIRGVEIKGFSKVPYMLLPNYSNECSNYCYPSRLFFQFVIPDNRQLQGIRLKNFRFRDKLIQSALVNYDSTKIGATFIKVKKHVNTYVELRSQLANVQTNDILFKGKVKTPTSANQGPGSASLVGVDANINFFNPDSNIEKSTFNLTHHALTSKICNSNLILDKIGDLSPMDVCKYLVFQRSIANQFGDAKFTVPLDKVRIVSNNPSLDIGLTPQKFFEQYLLGFKSIKFNTLSTSILTDKQWRIFSIFHLASTNSVLENLTLQFKDLDENFLEKLFSIPNIKDLKSFNLANNKLTLTSRTSNLLNKFHVSNLNLSNNKLDNSFIINLFNPKLFVLNVRNTGWHQVTLASLWQNIPNVEELFLSGTDIKQITLQDFLKILPNPDKIISIEADFANIDTLKMDDFNKSFTSLQRFNVPLTHYVVKNIKDFLSNSLRFKGKIGLPINGTEFKNTNPNEVFNVSQKIQGKITNFEGKEISLYYDLYLSFLFRNYLSKIEFFQDPFAKLHQNEAIYETIGSYKVLFDSANIAHSINDSFNVKHNRVVNAFKTTASLVQANITGKLLSKYLVENKQIMKEYGLYDYPSSTSINKIVLVIILIMSMFTALVSIVLILFFRFFK